MCDLGPDLGLDLGLDIDIILFSYQKEKYSTVMRNAKAKKKKKKSQRN